MNTEIPEFYDRKLTDYCTTSLFIQLSTSADYGESYRDAFRNISATEVPEIMTRLDHGSRDIGAVVAGMALTSVMIVVLGLRVFARLHFLSGRLKVEDWLVLVAAVCHRFRAKILIRNYVLTC